MESFSGIAIWGAIMDRWMGCPRLEFCSVETDDWPPLIAFLCVSCLDRLTFCSMKACYELLIFKVCTMTAVRLPRLSRPGVLESISPNACDLEKTLQLANK